MFDALAHQQTSVSELMLKTSPLQTLYGGQFTLSAQRIKPNFFSSFFFILGSEAVTVHELDWQKKGLPSGKEINLVIVLILNRVVKIQQIRIALILFLSISYTIIYIFLLLLQGGDWKHGRIGCDYSIVFFCTPSLFLLLCYREWFFLLDNRRSRAV